MTPRLSLVPPVVDPWTLDARAVPGATAVRFVEVAARNWMRLRRPEKAAQVLDVGLDYLTASYGKTGWLP